MAREHPHVDDPTVEQLEEAVAGRPARIRDVYLALDALVVDTLPDVVRSVDLVDAEIGYGARQYGYDGWGMAAVTPYSAWVSLALVRGALLEAPAGLLEGTGRLTRHVKVRSLEQLSDIGDGLRGLLLAAARLNQR